MNHLRTLINRLLPILLLSSQAVTVQAEDYLIYQGMYTDYGGELSSRYQKRFSDSDDSSSDVTEWVNTAEIGIQNVILGYIWRPWFGTWSGNNNIRLVQRWQDGDQFENSSLTGILGQTYWQSNLFPVSRFPLHASIEYSRSDEEQDYQDELVERYIMDIHQRYTSEDNQTTMSGRLTFSGRDSDISGESDETRFLADYHTTRDQHTFSADMEYLQREDDYDNDDSDESSLQQDEELSFYGRHRFNPDRHFSMENYANIFFTDSEYDSTDQERMDWQISNNNTWKPEAEPRFRLTSNLRLGGNETDTTSRNSDSDTDDQYFNVYAGAYFNYSDTLTYDATINSNISKTGSGSTIKTHQQRVGFNYTPHSFPLYSFTYNWYAAAGLSNIINDDETFQALNGSIGQTLNRDLFTIKDAPVVLRINSQFTDEISTQNDYDERSELSNRVSLNHNYTQEGLYSSAQLSFEDRRRFNGSGTDYKSIQTGRFILSGTYQLDRHAGWYADLNIEVINEELYNSESSLRYYSSGFIAYNDSRFLDVPLLKFSSSLTLSMEDYLSRDVIEQEQLSGDDDVVTTTWENRLTYYIGRLQVEARFDISKREEHVNGILWLEVKRRFGYY